MLNQVLLSPGTSLALAAPSSNGFALAIAILAGMVVALIYTAVMWVRASRNGFASVPQYPAWLDMAIPVVSVMGLGVAGYLTYVEVSGTEPVCGPVINGCRAVQASPYAKLFGVLPVGAVGLVAYVAVLAAWLVGQWGSAPMKRATRLAIWTICFLGVLFSIYLTYLELLVIKATCVWCITSAVLMVLLLWASTPAAQAIFAAGDGDN